MLPCQNGLHAAMRATPRPNPACRPQFDIINIPPAPKDVPRIEVVFHLSRDMFLTAEARDLDTARHKLWQQRGEIIVLKQ